MKQASYSINAKEERGNEMFEISKDFLKYIQCAMH